LKKVWGGSSFDFDAGFCVEKARLVYAKNWTFQRNTTNCANFRFILGLKLGL
jgi:hypothetical protein